LRVLFIGNSYTSANNLAGWVKSLLEEGGFGDGLKVQAITKGGAWLQHHFENPDTLNTIAGGNWTHVVLQGQSYLAVVSYPTFYDAAVALGEAVKSAGAVPVFFETWARKESNKLYTSDLKGYTPETMQKALREAYKSAAADTGGVYAGVGDAWEAAIPSLKDINLFSGDGSHPSVFGTYLAACVFYAELTGSTPEGLGKWPDGVSAAQAASLQAIAQAISKL
jgi:hypothetical protein